MSADPISTPGAGRLLQRGPLLVRPAGGGRISLATANAALEQTRDGDVERSGALSRLRRLGPDRAAQP